MNNLFLILGKNQQIAKFIALFLIILISITISSCALPDFAKPTKVSKNTPVNAKERARKNVEEGRGVSLKGMMGGKKSTNYEFSTSNPLWRASLEIIDFMPLATVDYSGGIIITDWYTDAQNFDESIKITVRFLSNEVRSDSIKIIVHNKKCKTDQSCTVNEIDSNIKFELQKSILRKAALLEKEIKKSN